MQPLDIVFAIVPVAPKRPEVIPVYGQTQRLAHQWGSAHDHLHHQLFHLLHLKSVIGTVDKTIGAS